MPVREAAARCRHGDVQRDAGLGGWRREPERQV